MITTKYFVGQFYWNSDKPYISDVVVVVVHCSQELQASHCYMTGYITIMDFFVLMVRFRPIFMIVIQPLPERYPDYS